MALPGCSALSWASSGQVPSGSAVRQMRSEFWLLARTKLSDAAHDCTVVSPLKA